MLFTQLIILFTFISQIICVSISDLNNIALIQFTKRRGSSGGQVVVIQVAVVIQVVVAIQVVVVIQVVEVQVVEVKVVDPAAALAVGLAVELKEVEVQVVEVHHLVVEIGVVINTTVREILVDMVITLHHQQQQR